VLEVVGWGAAFPWYLGADDYRQGKPHPEPFQRALERLGVAPTDALVLEDSSAGIAAARAAGIRVIAVRAGNASGQDQSAADLVVDSLHDIDDTLLAGF
jgi:sugar-phosphatase